MAKDTNTSKCPAMVSGCKFGHTVKTDLSLSNDGFILSFSVVCLGYLLEKKMIRSLSSSLYNFLNHCVSNLENGLVEDRIQPSLEFFGDDEPAF